MFVWQERLASSVFVSLDNCLANDAHPELLGWKQIELAKFFGKRLKGIQIFLNNEVFDESAPKSSWLQSLQLLYSIVLQDSVSWRLTTSESLLVNYGC